jgi:hypothetical protein
MGNDSKNNTECDRKRSANLEVTETEAVRLFIYFRGLHVLLASACYAA